MNARKPTRRQKELMYQKLGLDPNDWLVVKWQSNDDYITLASRFTRQKIQKRNPEVRV